MTDNNTEVMCPHAGDNRCICNDGRAEERDITEPCVVSDPDLNDPITMSMIEREFDHFLRER